MSPQSSIARTPIRLLLITLFWCAKAVGATPEEKARAAALFSQALPLLKQGNHQAACEKLEESFRLEPMGGTAHNLAICLEAQKKYASAWAIYDESRRINEKSGKKARVRFAQEGITRTERKMSKLAIQIALLDSANVDIKLDQKPLGKGALGDFIPIDPGAHIIHVSSLGPKPWAYTVTVIVGQEADRKTVTIPRMETDSTHVPSVERKLPAPMLPQPRQQTPETAEKRVRPVALALTLGASGLLGLGVATWAGFRVNSLKLDANALASKGNLLAANETLQEAQTHRTVGLVSLGIGAGCLTLGTVLFFALSRKEQAVKQTANSRWLAIPMIAHTTGGITLITQF